MPKANPEYNLYVLKPNLVKEWHPTKNGSLKPSDVTPGSGKKVWWLCNEGHEWQAVIYSRSRGSGCRFCNNIAKTYDSLPTISIQSLIKEWHPTKNGSLIPRNLVSYWDKKVWWLCEKSHEWNATVKSRSRGNGCPICSSRFVNSGYQNNKSGRSRKEYTDHDIYQKDPVDTYFGTEFRKSKRFKQEVVAMLEVSNSGHLIYAQMQNHSKDGMYFETEVAIKPGTRVNIKFDKPILHTPSKIYNSIVKWCKGLSDTKGPIHTYGLGVKFI